MFAAFGTFGTSEWLRFALTILLCIPLFVIGMYLFGLFPDIIKGREGSKRRKVAEGKAAGTDAEKTETK